MTEPSPDLPVRVYSEKWWENWRQESTKRRNLARRGEGGLGNRVTLFALNAHAFFGMAHYLASEAWMLAQSELRVPRR